MANLKRKGRDLEALQGNPGRRGRGKKVELVEAGAPEMPAHYKREKKYGDVWRELVKQLAKTRVLTEGDGMALEMLTDALVSYREVEMDLRKGGYKHKTKNGYEQIRPCVTMLNLRSKQLRGLLEQFGLTPASRSRAERAGSGEKDPLGEFLSN